MMSVAIEHDEDLVPVEPSPSLALLPEDLRLWVPPDRLAYLALEALQSSHASRWPARFETPTGSFPTRMLATLMVYAYAAGVGGSRDLEEATRHERTIRYLCAYNPPDWHTLRLFRRRHAALLTACLARLLAYAWTWRQRTLAGDTRWMEGGGEILQSHATHSTPDFHHEASLRLMRAIRVDSMSLDD